jgi:hypothetical protein
VTDERDPKVSHRYRELPSDEPRRALDRAIIAAAHRATERPRAPLVVPAGRHRWYYAIGAVAVLVLAVGVTLHLQPDRPDSEALPATERPMSPPPTARDAAEPSLEKRSAPAAAARPPERRFEDLSREAPPQEGARVPPTAPETPEQWIARIEQLRKEAKHEEADRQLSEFRRSYPDYKVPDAALRPGK